MTREMLGVGGAPDPPAPPVPCPALREQQGAQAAADGEPRQENGDGCPGGQSALLALGPSEEQEGQRGAEPPEGGWGWVVMLAAMWCNGAVFGIQNSCGVLFVSMLNEFGSQDDKQLVFKTAMEAEIMVDDIQKLENEVLRDQQDGKRIPSPLPSLNWGPVIPDNLKRFWVDSRDLQAGEDNDTGGKGTST